MDPLRRGFSDLLDDPKYSDLQIICQGVTFHVHRNVVCPQSKVIERECDGEWLEAGTRRIVNEVFEPLVVDRMLQYMYRGEYELREGFVGAAVPGPSCEEARTTRSRSVDVDGRERAQTEEKEHPLIQHVRVYAVADYYDIPKLRELVVEKFELQYDEFEETITSEQLAHVAAVLYANTPPSAHKFRDQMLEAACLSDQASYNNRSFMKLLAERPELQQFSVDLLTKVVRMHAKHVQGFEQERKKLRRKGWSKDAAMKTYQTALSESYEAQIQLQNQVNDLREDMRNMERRLRETR